MTEEEGIFRPAHAVHETKYLRNEALHSLEMVNPPASGPANVAQGPDCHDHASDSLLLQEAEGLQEW
jgi:hypothetical protein